MVGLLWVFGLFFFFGLWPVVVFNGGVGFQYGVDL